MSQPRILCVSLSPIARDARVLRQISLLSELGEVTTVGYGPKPEGVRHHLEVPSTRVSLPQTMRGVVNLALRAHKNAECSAPAAQWVLNEQAAKNPVLGGPWNLVVANDARVLDLTYRLAAGAPIWADMHEWAPEEQTDIIAWRLLVAPFMSYLCKKYLPEAALVTTVSRGIAELYEQVFGVHTQLFTNACEYRNIKPSTVRSGVVRCVHSGLAVQGRGLDQMLQVFARLPSYFTLDLYLVEGGDGGSYLAKLRAMAGDDPRFTFHDPVSPHELPGVLSQYDVGVYWIPPLHTNARLSFPNKFFDFVQARLALAIGPSEEMQREVERYGMGVVSRSFELEDIVESMKSITPEKVQQYQLATDRAADDLNFENEAKGMRRRLVRVLNRSAGYLP